MTTLPSFEIFKRDGTRIEFTSAFSTDAEALDYLDANCRWSEFATSLVNQHRDRGRLSDVQYAWVHKLATDAVERAAKKRPALAPVGKAEFHGIRQLVDRAFEAGKKFPRIDLRTAAGQRVVLARSGPSSRVPGAIRITDGRPYGQNTFFGTIDLDGTARLVRGNVTDEVRDLLNRLDEAPAAVSAQHGVATGNCCYCGRDLTTKESRSVGYGPICADKFGLPWGEVSPEVEAAHEAAKTLPEDCQLCDGLGLIGEDCTPCPDCN